MDPIVVAIISFFVLLFMIFIGIHIGVALIFVSILGMWCIVGNFVVACKILGTQPFYVTFDYILSVIPLFILMGLFVNISGASDDLYDAAHVWTQKMTGGLGIATVIANAVFAAISGISVASAAMFSKVALPQMIRLGYNKRLSLGTIAGSSVLGMLIPPSVLLIVYGVLAEESIGRLFVAGIIPGILLVIIYSLGIWAMGRFRPQLTGGGHLSDSVPFKEKCHALLKTSGIVLLILLVLGGIYAGVFTPTEAGGIGTIGALILVIFKHRAKLSVLKTALQETGVMTATFFLLLIGAQLYSRMLAMSGIVSQVAEFVVALTIPPLLIIALIMVTFIIMGAFLDCISIMIIMLPILLPTIKALGFDYIWFGIVSVIAIETGLITPPFGMVPFTIKAAIGDMATLEDIFIGSAPFLIMMIALMTILILIPSLITWLPATM